MNTIDTVAGGALTDKTPIEARELISRMTENSQSFENRASELDNSLTKEVSTPFKVTKCGVHGLVGHPNDKCPEVIEDVNIVRRYDPHGTNLEDIIKALATNTLSFQQEMKQQMTQLTTAISKMDGKEKLPAQPNHANNESKEEKVETNPSPSNSKNDNSPLNDFTPYIPKPPFPSRLAPKKKETPKEEEILEMFRKVQINLPLLDAIQQVLRYAKFLKELCTNKKKTKERPMINQNVSVLLKSNIPENAMTPVCFLYLV
ncbi:retrotransposon gag protein [Cucumis melo var. makuwa]|uniref:Retrotransposon gag protein n=1 Tax=Cucumis melo var. makuwa TaxID=1194695 RepID=A0A5A7TV43_CUCMM|nr:retrotransposon gag protein [Cucumis melo var. makuwa]